METKKSNEEYYEMYTKQGDRAVHSLTEKVIRKVDGKMKVNKEELDQMIIEGMKKVAEKHGEVYDTEPSYHISRRVNEALQRNGYGFVLSRYDW